MIRNVHPGPPILIFFPSRIPDIGGQRSTGSWILDPGSEKLSHSHRTFYLKLSIMSWKRLPPPVVSAAAAEVEGPPAPPLQLSCSFRSLHRRRRLNYKKHTDWERAREISCNRFKTVRRIRNPIRILNDLYGSGSGPGFGSFHQQAKKIKRNLNFNCYFVFLMNCCLWRLIAMNLQ